MELSRSILKDFAKTVSEPEKTDKKLFARGTVTVNGDKKYVKIDGSEYQTPISELSDVQNGDRVFVTIENHKATVLGNFSYPIPRVATAAKEKADSIERTLEADYVKTAMLEADYVKTATLEANYVKTVTLEADYVKTATLEADYVKTVTLEADYVKTATLEADYVKTNVLEAQYVKTNRLDAVIGTFGYVKTSSIDANFASAVVANIKDGTITSALIKDLDAAKITNLSIDTTKVTIFSNSDSKYSKWQDNTIIFADKGKDANGNDVDIVRIQIGEDAQGHYNMYIWDQNGKALFNATGITEDAIPEKVIKNNMIDDHAIKSGKLDVDSLFEEINKEDDTRTIKSSKVFLNEKEQTLDVAFKNITTFVDGSTLMKGTDVNTSLGGFSISTWITKVDKALKSSDPTKTDYSNFEVTVNSITSTVNAHDGRITTVKQTADKINWLVESGDNSSNFTLTDRVAELLSAEFKVDALTTFMNSAHDGSSTVIDGGSIKANTITADKLSVTNLSSVSAKIGGFDIEGNCLSALYSENGGISIQYLANIKSGDTLLDVLKRLCSVSLAAAYDTYTVGFECDFFDDANNGNVRYNVQIGNTAESSNGPILICKSNHANNERPLECLWLSTDGITIMSGTDEGNLSSNAESFAFYDINLKIDKGTGLMLTGTNGGTIIRTSNAGNLFVGSGTGGHSGGIYNTMGYQKKFAIRHHVEKGSKNLSGTTVTADTEEDLWYILYHTDGEKMVVYDKVTLQHTTSSAANMVIGSTGLYWKGSSSSRRYKEDITEKLSDRNNPHSLYDLHVVEFKYKHGYLSEEDVNYNQKVIGFIAEDVAQVFPVGATYNEDGTIENWNERFIIPGMLKLVQEQHIQIDDLTVRFDTTEERIESLQNQLSEAMLTIAEQQKQIDILKAAS